MRHRKAKGRLGRSTASRKALLRSLASHLIERQRITTTLVRAKELRSFVDPLITLGKKNTPTARKNAIGMLGSKIIINRLFDEVAPVFAGRSGGYTRVIRISNRRGDGAPMAIIELTEKAAEEKKPEKTAVKKAVRPSFKLGRSENAPAAPAADRKVTEAPKEPEAPAAAAPPGKKEDVREPKKPEVRKPEPKRKDGKGKDGKEKLDRGFMQGLKKYFRGKT